MPGAVQGRGPGRGRGWLGLEAAGPRTRPREPPLWRRLPPSTRRRPAQPTRGTPCVCLPSCPRSGHGQGRLLLRPCAGLTDAEDLTPPQCRGEGSSLQQLHLHLHHLRKAQTRSCTHTPSPPPTPPANHSTHTRTHHPKALIGLVWGFFFHVVLSDVVLVVLVVFSASGFFVTSTFLWGLVSITYTNVLLLHIHLLHHRLCGLLLTSPFDPLVYWYVVEF